MKFMKNIKYFLLVIWILSVLVFSIHYFTAFVISVILYFLFEVVMQGNLSFWKKAGKKPDFVYEQLIRDYAWLIDDGLTQINKRDCVGPFRLYVPRLGGVVKFYGMRKKYVDSQKRIEMIL